MSEKKKLCILQNGFAWGGTDTFVINLCSGLDKDSFDITVVNPSDDQTSLNREKELRELGVKVLRTTPLYGIKGKIKHLVGLYKILKRGRFDIFHSNIDLFNGPQMLVAALAGVPIRCCHSHNSRQGKELITGRTLQVRIYQGIMRWMCWTFSNRRIGCSAEAMNFLFRNRSWHKANHPVVIFNGIELSRFKHKIDKQEKKKELGIEPDGKVIITIGHLIAQKNPVFTAEIVSEVIRKDERVNMLWVGGGHLKESVMEILRRNGIVHRVKFLEGRKDIDELLKCADVFILPSSFEGLGIVAIEAQASGIPCVLSNQVPQEVNCGGAIFLPIDDGADVWVETISEILDRRIKVSTIDSEIKRYSIENMVSQMTKVFEP